MNISHINRTFSVTCWKSFPRSTLDFFSWDCPSFSMNSMLAKPRSITLRLIRFANSLLVAVTRACWVALFNSWYWRANWSVRYRHWSIWLEWTEISWIVRVICRKVSAILVWWSRKWPWGVSTFVSKSAMEWRILSPKCSLMACDDEAFPSNVWSNLWIKLINWSLLLSTMRCHWRFLTFPADSLLLRISCKLVSTIDLLCSSRRTFSEGFVKHET